MTVAEMTERMSAREFAQWRAYFKAEKIQHDRMISQTQQRARRRRTR